MTQIPLNPANNDGLKIAGANGGALRQSQLGSKGGLAGLRSATLARQLLATVLPLSLAPLLITSVIGFLITQNRAQSEIREKLEGEALLVSSSVDQELSKDLEAVQALAISPFIAEVTAAAAETAEIDGLVGQSVEALEADFAGSKQVTSDAFLNSYLERLAATEDFAEILLTERNGLTVGYSNVPSDFVQSDEDWWQQGTTQSQLIGEPELDASAGQFGFALVQRIETPETQELLGVTKTFVSSASFSFIEDFLRDAGISGTQQVQLLDVSSGLAFANFSPGELELPGTEADARQIIGGSIITEIAARLVEVDTSGESLDAEVLAESLAAAYPIANLDVRLQTGAEGGQNFAVFFEYEDKEFALSPSHRVDWVAIASMDISEVRAQGRGQLGLFAIIAAVLGGVAAVITVGLSRRLSSPLNDLSDKARQVSAGNLNVMVQPQGTIETQGLAQTFNDLVVRVKRSLGEEALNTRKEKLFGEITGTNITQTSELDTLYNQAVTEARDILQCDRVIYYLFDSNSEGRVVAESAASNLPSALDSGLRVPFMTPETRAQYLSNNTLQVDEINTAQFSAEHLQLLQNLRVRSILAVPIKFQDQLYGLVIAHHCQSRYSWQPSEIDFLRQLGFQTGRALDRLRLLQQTAALAEEQRLNAQKSNLFAEITGANVINSDELDGLFSQIVAEARTLLKSDRVVFYQFGKNWEGWVSAESAADHLPSAFDQGLSDPCIPQETRDKYLADGILQVDDVDKAEFNPAHLQLLKNLQVRSILAVAIQSQGQLYGLVITHHCHQLHTWQHAEIDFLKQLGLQIGRVIERINLQEQTTALAEEQRQIKEGLQRSALKLLMEVDPVSQGDLTVRARVTEDEIGTIADSYNATISSLRKIVTQVKTAAEQVSATTAESDQSVRKLSDSALQQAHEIAIALDRAQEMANSVRQVANNARTAEQAVQQAAQTVYEGDAAMNRTVDGILAIRETVAETAKKVKRLGESSQKISNVVNLISGFAAQTNMLALNASIEASRAGEGGKGFAVVAEEVRELARQSAEATTEIEKLVAGIQMETNDVVLAMEEGTQQVVDGTRLVDETRQSLNRITAASEQISVLVEAITQTTIVQSQASEAVTATMTNVAAIANQNSQEANQVSNSFEELNTVAQALQGEVDRFKIS